jgi:hypothetical protein
LAEEHAGDQTLSMHDIEASINIMLEGNKSDGEISGDLLNVSPATIYDLSQPAGSSGASLDGSYTTAFPSADFQEQIPITRTENQFCGGMESIVDMEDLWSMVDINNPGASEFYEFLNSLQ